MQEEGPVAAVLAAVAAQLQLGSMSCTPNHHHCVGGTFQTCSFMLKWLACIKHLSWQSVSSHTLHMKQK